MASIAARVQRGPWRMKTYTEPLRLRISLEILVRESGIMRKICSKHLLFSEESHEAAYDTELLVVTGRGQECHTDRVLWQRAGKEQ